jgi:hypothetical protein
MECLRSSVRFRRIVQPEIICLLCAMKPGSQTCKLPDLSLCQDARYVPVSVVQLVASDGCLQSIEFSKAVPL